MSTAAQHIPSWGGFIYAAKNSGRQLTTRRREASKHLQQDSVPPGLEIGDIVLYSPVRPSAKQILIQSAQGRCFGEEHARYTHVALYVGDGDVVDSISEGIGVRPLSTLTSDGRVRVRRLKGIQPHQQRAICVEAKAMSGKYAKVTALADGLRMLGVTVPPSWAQLLSDSTYPGRTSNETELGHVLYCGQLVDLIYLKVRNATIVSDDVFAPVPAGFSADDRLFDDV